MYAKEQRHRYPHQFYISADTLPQTGRRVWVPDGEVVWRMAEVVAESVDGNSYTVLSRDGKAEQEVSH